MNTKTQPTIWGSPDDVWTLIEPILCLSDPTKPKEHRHVELRPMLKGRICRLHTASTMESAAYSVWRRSHRAQALPALVPTWPLGSRRGCAG
jgi:hypothetical protein